MRTSNPNQQKQEALNMNLQALRQKLSGLCDQQQAIVDAALAAGRAMNKDEKVSYDSFQDQINSMIDTIKAAEAVDARAADLNKPAASPMRPSDVVVGADRELLKPFANLGEQLKAIYHAAQNPGATDRRLLQINNAAAGMSEGVPSDGGFALQTDFAGALMDTAVQTGQISSRCDSYEVSSPSNAAKWMDIDESNVSSTVFGGVQVYWAHEAATVSASKPKLMERRLELEKIMGIAYATDELLQDTTFITNLYTRAFTTGIQRKVEGGVISGSGVGECLGILNSGSLVTVAAEAGQPVDTVIWKNISKMWNRLLPDVRANSVWLVNPDVEEQFDFLEFPVGTGGVPVYLPAGGAAASPLSTLKGRPVIPTDHCSAIGDVGDLVLADLNDYMLIGKGGVQMATSIHVQFLTGEQAFRFVFRTNGGPKRMSALTMKNTSNARSTFVTLAAR
jgi:HK97 family phage major capsid protein